MGVDPTDSQPEIGPQCNYHEGWAAKRHYANQPARWGLLRVCTTSPINRLLQSASSDLYSGVTELAINYRSQQLAALWRRQTDIFCISYMTKENKVLQN